MSKQYKSVIRTFFSDYLSWLLIVSALFVISLVATIAFGNANGFIWIVPVLFLVIYCFSLPLLILYSRAKKDIKNRNIEQITIKNFTQIAITSWTPRGKNLGHGWSRRIYP